MHKLYFFQASATPTRRALPCASPPGAPAAPGGRPVTWYGLSLHAWVSSTPPASRSRFGHVPHISPSRPGASGTPSDADRSLTIVGHCRAIRTIGRRAVGTVTCHTQKSPCGGRPGRLATWCRPSLDLDRWAPSTSVASRAAQSCRARERPGRPCVRLLAHQLITNPFIRSTSTSNSGVGCCTPT